MYTNRHFFEYWAVFPILGILLVVLFVLDLILRAIALWRSARNGQLFWFIALLFLNTMSVLPIIYLLIFAKDLLSSQKSKLPATKKSTRQRKR